MNIILFHDDWKKFPSAIADTKTKNESFLRLVALYKKMGIKNSDFCLALNQGEMSAISLVH